MQEAAKRKVEKRRKLFQEKSARLNYLVGTKVQPGVFNGPYHEQPTVDGVPLEKCIKQNVNAYLKKNKLDRKKSVLKPYPRRNKMSIQVCSVKVTRVKFVCLLLCLFVSLLLLFRRG